MIYLILPRGNSFGWGVCGKYLVKELSQITEVKYITHARLSDGQEFNISDIGNGLDFYFLQSKLVEKEVQKLFSKSLIKTNNFYNQMTTRGNGFVFYKLSWNLNH